MKIESAEDYYSKMNRIRAFTYVRDRDGDIYQQSDRDGLFWAMGTPYLQPVESLNFPLETLDD